MKVILAIILVSFISVIMAHDIITASNKKEALQSCKEKASSSPPELQKKMLAACRCIVEHTNFSQAKKLNQEGQTEALQILYKRASMACPKCNIPRLKLKEATFP
ncbi:MAG: hypothetical protein ACWIPH_04605 [Ostreibacterium sp.]